MPLRRRAQFLVIYIGIVIAMLVMYFHVQKNYRHIPSQRRGDVRTRTLPSPDR